MDKERGRKEGNVVVVRVSCGKEIGAVRECIRSSELGTRDMGELEVKIS